MVFALRLRAYGKRQYVTLGHADKDWTPNRAEEQLANVLADVRRGIWQPPTPEPEPGATSWRLRRPSTSSPRRGLPAAGSKGSLRAPSRPTSGRCPATFCPTSPATA